MDEIGIPFCKEQKTYPVTRQGDAAAIAQALHRKYRPAKVVENSASTFYTIFSAILSVLRPIL
jgi:hypothetical protein